MFINQERPAYRVLDPNGFFGPDDTLYKEGAEVYFDGEPNEELEPLNELAKAKVIAYVTKLDTMARLAAEKMNKPFVGRPRTLDGALDLATEAVRQNMSIMGAKNKPVTIESLGNEGASETGNSVPKRGRGRPRKDQTLASVS